MNYLLAVIILIYIAMMVLVGYIAWKRTSSNEDYLVAGRKTSSFIMALSYGATFISTAAIVGFGGLAGTNGMGILWLVFLNIAVGIFIAFVFFGKPTRAIGKYLNALTFPEFLSKRLLFILKTLESLLFLYEIEIENEKIDQRTYSDETIRVVRYIKNSLSRNIASYVSLETLSMSYGINLTTLKNCFKDMYGKPLYTWYKEYKFYRAKELIKNTDYPISKIAYMVGYKSSSKFAKAFKKEMGVLPSSYRKNKK